MTSRIATLLLLLALVSGCALAQAHPPSKPGQFDYYLLSLSWSPQYCFDVGAGAEEAQCDPARHFGFVVHGLWPQNAMGMNPRACRTATQLDPATAQSMLDLMPSRDLIEHEWGSHGSCSGVSAPEFFRLVRRAATQIRIPAPYQRPAKTQMVKVAEFRKALLAANPNLHPGQFAIYCDDKALREVRVCLDKGLVPQACGARVHDSCGLDQVLMRALK
jgi:ribonuclease T2